MTAAPTGFRQQVTRTAQQLAFAHNDAEQRRAALEAERDTVTRGFDRLALRQVLGQATEVDVREAEDRLDEVERELRRVSGALRELKSQRGAIRAIRR